MPDAAGVGGWGGGEVPQGQGGQGAGLCMGHGCLLSSGVTLCGRWLQAQRVRLSLDTFCSQENRCPGAAGQLGQAAVKPPTAVGDLPSASSTGPLRAARHLSVPLASWGPRSETRGRRASGRPHACFHCPGARGRPPASGWPCLLASVRNRMTAATSAPGREQRAAAGLGRAEGERPQRAAPPWSPLCGCPSSSPGARGAASRGSDSPVVNQAPRKAL